MVIEERIKELREKLENTPVNKGTEKERAKLKSQISRLEERKELRDVKKRGKQGFGYSIKKSGNATISLVGPPSTGKSTLLNKITNVSSKVADYEFTTLEVVPGMLDYKGAKIQILDIPGLVVGASEGKGHGKEVLSVIRNTDLILLVTDLEKVKELKELELELHKAGIRINQKRPEIKLRKRTSGGIRVMSTLKLDLGEETIKEVLKECGISNCDLIIRENISTDQLIDFLSPNRVYIPCLEILNKIDLISKEKLKELGRKNPRLILISAKKGKNLDFLKEKIWENLNLMRVYMKKIKKEVDFEEPLIIKRDSTVIEVCEKIHKRFKERFNYAKVWGESAKFEGQVVGKNHVLKDKDVLELHFK